MTTRSTPFSLFLALRYLKPKRSFVSVITIISILGVTLGIAVMIIVISVMQGFDTELQQTVLGFEPDVDISSDGPINDWRQIIAQLDKTPGVVAAAPQVEGPVIAEHEHIVTTPILEGINPTAELKVVNLKSLIKEGDVRARRRFGHPRAGRLPIHSMSTSATKSSSPGRAICAQSSRRFARRGTTPTRPKNSPTSRTRSSCPPMSRSPASSSLAGTSTMRISSSSPFRLAQELYVDGGRRPQHRRQDHRPGAAAISVATPSTRRLREPAYAQTWMDRNQDRFDAIRIERTVMFFILMFIVIVASFGIMNTLITVTVQKTREIGIMKALGATTPQIIWVFMIQGMVVGFFGNLAGLLIGVGAVRYRNEFLGLLRRISNMKIFPADIYDFAAIPAQIVPRDVAIICISGFVICSLAAFLPAWFAARLDPVTALRYE